jgi:glycosyltransferase involved in cell wall biosynthesis
MLNDETVSVIMPVYNEGATVRSVIKRVLGQKAVDALYIVYDKSTDNTLAEIRAAMKGSDAKGRAFLVMSDAKRGKGRAVKQGMARIRDGIVLIQDADEEYYPEDYPKMLAALTDSNPVFGSRESNAGHKYFLGSLATVVHTLAFNLLYGQSIKDMNAAYKLFKVHMLKGKKLSEDGWQIDQEIACTLAKNGYRILSVPIRYKGRTFEEGKKIGPKAAVMNLFYIVKERFSR